MSKFKVDDQVRVKADHYLTGKIIALDSMVSTLPYLVKLDHGFGDRWSSEASIELIPEEPDTTEYTLEEFTDIELAEELLRRAKERCKG